MGSYVEVRRGDLLESRHALHAAVMDAGGRCRAEAGNPDLVTFFRSAAKPFQALPLIIDGCVDRLGLPSAELALCCGSHSGTADHVRTAESILERVGCSSADLACGAHPPFDEHARRELAAAGLEPGRVHNNCSGKHGGMLALARTRGWETKGYERSEHPVQRRVLASVAEWVGLPCEAIALGVEGCGVACFGFPLQNMALAYARLAASARRGDAAPAAIVGAMVDHPRMVAGDGRICTELMRRAEGRIVAKVGAEGI